MFPISLRLPGERGGSADHGRRGVRERSDAMDRGADRQGGIPARVGAEPGVRGLAWTREVVMKVCGVAMVTTATPLVVVGT